MREEVNEKHIVEKFYYCDNCNTKHDENMRWQIGTCAKCKKEICHHCSTNVSVIDDDQVMTSRVFDQDQIYIETNDYCEYSLTHPALCKECAKDFDQGEYYKELNEAIQKVNKILYKPWKDFVESKKGEE